MRMFLLISILAGVAPATGRAAENPPIPAAVLHAPSARGDAVKVERARPEKSKRPTLVFLRENRDFLRGRVDGLTEVLRDAGRGDRFDPAHLDYLRRLRAAVSARDSLLALGHDLRRGELLAEIADLARFESDLDLVEQLILEQGGRLDRLEADFAGRQETGLLVLLGGHPAEVLPDSLVLVDGFERQTVYVFDPLRRESLRTGALARIYHRFIEPRDQAITLQVFGAGLLVDTGTVELTPDRHRLNVLVLNLDGVDRERGILGLEARTWSEAPFVERVAFRGDEVR